MADTYTTNLRLRRPGTGDRNWDVPLVADLDALDGQTALGCGAVVPVETPSATLNVKVAASLYRDAAGVVQSYAGTSSQAMTASSTNYLYLTNAGTLTVNTTGFPATIPHVRLASVVAGGSTITSVSDQRTRCQVVATGGPTLAVAGKTAAYTTTAADALIRADAAGGAFTVTLPTAVGITGKIFWVKRTSASNNVTVGTTSSQTIDGASTKTLTTQYATIAIVSNGTNWDTLSTLGTVT